MVLESVAEEEEFPWRTIPGARLDTEQKDAMRALHRLSREALSAPRLAGIRQGLSMRIETKTLDRKYLVRLARRGNENSGKPYCEEKVIRIMLKWDDRCRKACLLPSVIPTNVSAPQVQRPPPSFTQGTRRVVQGVLFLGWLVLGWWLLADWDHSGAPLPQLGPSPGATGPSSALVVMVTPVEPPHMPLIHVAPAVTAPALRHRALSLGRRSTFLARMFALSVKRSLTAKCRAYDYFRAVPPPEEALCELGPAYSNLSTVCLPGEAPPARPALMNSTALSSFLVCWPGEEPGALRPVLLEGKCWLEPGGDDQCPLQERRLGVVGEYFTLVPPRKDVTTSSPPRKDVTTAFLLGCLTTAVYMALVSRRELVGGIGFLRGWLREAYVLGQEALEGMGFWTQLGLVFGFVLPSSDTA